ncbi:hypothetical protein ACOPJQ_05530 [Luteimonas dalianensis]|uniref:hypothetical protein n=1 Tax=Luteimonas dalianensis TaxID=1148196 RepID=UPI003BF2D81E
MSGMEKPGELKPLRVLFDNSLYYFANDDDLVVNSVPVEVGGVAATIRIAQVEPREFKDWRGNERQALRELCELARRGEIEFCTSTELYGELSDSRESWRPGRTGNEMLEGIEFEFLDSPVERTRFFSGVGFGAKKDRLDFCQFLRTLASAQQSPCWLGRFDGQLPERQKSGLADVGRFSELCTGLSDDDEKMIDMFHLWTGEFSKVDYFLTFDRKLINFVNQTSKVEVRCSPISPYQLLQKLRT